MTASPSLEPAPTGRDELSVRVTQDVPRARTTDDLVVIVTPDVAADPVPDTSQPAKPAPVAEKHAPRLVTALVGLGLVAVAGAMVVSATDNDSSAPTTVPARSAAVSAPVALPTTVRILGAQRTGDVVLLRVDPAGNAGARSLVVAPDASVLLAEPVGVLAAGSSNTLQSFVDVAGAPSVRQQQWHLRYDDDGAVSAISLTP